MKDANGTGTGDKTVKKRRIIVFGTPQDMYRAG
jgi:hypothetical protein